MYFSTCLSHNKIKHRIEENKQVTNTIIAAESQNEHFTNVTILTLDTYNEEYVMELLSNTNHKLENLPNKIKEFKKSLPITEFIQIFDDKILVVINANIIDDYIVNKVTLLLFKVENFSPGQRVFFNGETNTIIKCVNS